MAVSKIVGAPQLSRILDGVSPDLAVAFLRSPNLNKLASLPDDIADEDSALIIRDHVASLPSDDLRAIEHQAVRVSQLCGPRADALHLRLAAGRHFDCSNKLTDQLGVLGRAVWSFGENFPLFVATERAMQVRSFRDNQRIFQAYELVSPSALNLEDFEEESFAREVAERLSLQHGCRADAVELPEGEASPRQIMIAISAAGARESLPTFEPDKSVGVVQYRPVNELILVYMPDIGRVELCGRQWSDRKIVADVFARDVLGEDLSKRPLTQRSYDLSKFRGDLNVAVPPGLEDRIRSVDVTELRIALGSYDRKITLTVAAGEDIEALRRDVFGALRSRHGQGFVCDVELFLKVALPERGEKTLRFRLTNHNTSTLQSQTDPDLRAIGFALLEAWGVVRTTRAIDGDEREALMPLLLELLDHPDDEISGPELKQMNVDTPRLTTGEFLRRRQVVETILIDDEDLGELQASVSPDVSRGTADIMVATDDVDRTLDLEEVSRWSIDRDYILQTVLDEMSDLGLSGRPRTVSEHVHHIGMIVSGSEAVPLFLASRLQDDKSFAEADRDIRGESSIGAGLVLTPTHAPTDHLGTHLVLSLRDLLQEDRLNVDEILTAVRSGAGRSKAGAAVSFKKFSHGRAELNIPGKPVWTIVGEKRVLIVERLFQAHESGERMVKPKTLLDYSGAAQLGSTFGRDWTNRIQGTYIYSPRNTFWSLMA